MVQLKINITINYKNTVTKFIMVVHLICIWWQHWMLDIYTASYLFFLEIPFFKIHKHKPKQIFSRFWSFIHFFCRFIHIKNKYISKLYSSTGSSLEFPIQMTLQFLRAWHLSLQRTAHKPTLQWLHLYFVWHCPLGGAVWANYAQSQWYSVSLCGISPPALKAYRKPGKNSDDESSKTDPHKPLIFLLQSHKKF